MATVRVIHDIDDLARDMARIPTKLARKAAPAVKRHVEMGSRTARKFARQYAGPHGENYYKRITPEMTSPFSGEWGPEGEPKSNFVGAGYRNSAPNMDLPNSADIVGPKFHDSISKIVDGLFW